jgi:uncharacterized protein YciI
MYVMIITYKRPLEEIEAHLAAHRAYLATFYETDKLLASGPQIPRTGGIVLGDFASEEEAKAFVEGDPFTKEGLAEYKVLQFTPVLSSPRLQLKTNN